MPGHSFKPGQCITYPGIGCIVAARIDRVTHNSQLIVTALYLVEGGERVQFPDYQTALSEIYVSPEVVLAIEVTE